MTRLEQLRRERGLTPERLARLAGVAGMTIRRIEAGKDARLSTLSLIAEALDVENPWDLIEQVTP